jgi:hypothetical protein
VKFLVLMAEADHFDRCAGSSDAEQQAVFDCFTACSEAVRERGSLLQGEALADPAGSRTLTAGDVARLLPPAYTVEVRPVVST